MQPPTARRRPADQLGVWGWRVPFLLAAPAAAVALFLRSHMEDPEEWRAARERERGELEKRASRALSRRSSRAESLRRRPAAGGSAAALAAAGGGSAGPWGRLTPCGSSGGAGAQGHAAGPGEGAVEAKAPQQHAAPGPERAARDGPAAGASAFAADGGINPSGPCGACADSRACVALAGLPAAQMLRHEWRGFLLHSAVVAWLLSLYYVAYAWMPSHLRSSGVSPILSQAMLVTALVLEMASTIAGGWLAPRVRRLPAAFAAAPPLGATAAAAVLAVFGTGSAGGSWAALCALFVPTAMLLGVQSAAFPYVYPAATRSTGHSLAYSLGSAAGGAAPAAVSGVSLALARAGAEGAAACAAAIWLAALAPVAAAAALALPRAAPQMANLAAAHAAAAAEEREAERAAGGWLGSVA